MKSGACCARDAGDQLIASVIQLDAVQVPIGNLTDHIGATICERHLHASDTIVVCPELKLFHNLPTLAYDGF